MSSNRVVKFNCRSAAAIIAAALFSIGAAASTKTTASVSIPAPSGSWLYTVTIPGAKGAAPIVFEGLETYSNGGGYSEADQLSFTPGYLATAGHGAWAMTSKRTFLLSYENLTYAKGQATGTSKVHQNTLLSVDGKTYVGHGDFAYYDVNGKLIAGASGTFEIRAKKS